MANLTDSVTLDDLERSAATCLDKTTFDYFSTGADDDVTLHENRQAFKRYTYLHKVHVSYDTGLLTLTRN